MNQDKLKILIKNLELIVESLKAEVYSSPEAYVYEKIAPYVGDVRDYDEVFEDDDD
jgi:hypothetical protein